MSSGSSITFSVRCDGAGDWIPLEQTSATVVLMPEGHQLVEDCYLLTALPEDIRTLEFKWAFTESGWGFNMMVFDYGVALL